jgi:hypothetical protein
MPAEQLIINVGGSALTADLGNLQPWHALLNCADSIAVQRKGREMLRVDLSGQKRWIVFRRKVAGCPLICIGFQETPGASPGILHSIGGSNRKVLAWLGSDNVLKIQAYTNSAESQKLCNEFSVSWDNKKPINLLEVINGSDN